MKKSNLVLVMFSLVAPMLAANTAAPTPDNYRGVIQGVMAKFDRDWKNVNPRGESDPGALSTLETFLGAMNTMKINGPGQYHKFFREDGVNAVCDSAGPNCQELKIEVRNSIHKADSTLFGVQQAFDYDIIVWSNETNGFERFLEGFYTRVPGGIGKGNLTVISCGGCSTVGHAQVEWDGTGTSYRLSSHMYDTRFDLQSHWSQ